MERLIVQLGIMSVQAAIVICVILLVRIIFARLHVPKKYVMLLWFIPYILMVCPWKIESSFSFWQVMEHEQMDKVQTVVQHVQNDLEQKDHETDLAEEWKESGYKDESTKSEAVNIGGWMDMPITDGNGSSVTELPQQDVPISTDINKNSMEFVELLLQAAIVLWLVGVVAILLYSTISYLKLKRTILCSICVSENIYYADDIDSPFVLGIFRPRIYLPSSMPQENLHYVLEHERTHIRKGDPFKKMLAFGISIIHWFNPFAWVAFYFFGKDMEMACDEETVTRLGIENKQDYATALLQLASGKKRLLGAPLAFGEGSVKGRIHNIVKYKKVWKIVSVVAILVVAVLAVGFLTKHNAVTTLGGLDDDDYFVGFGNQTRRIQLTMEGKTTDFPEAYFENFMNFIKEIEVERIPVSLSRSEDRAKDVQIQIGDGGYIYLNSDCSEIWFNDGVKPSKSYGIVNPQAVQEFLKKQVNSVIMVEEAKSDNVKPDNMRSEQNLELLPEGTGLAINADVVNNLNKQLALIASQKEIWMMDTAYDLENYAFAVTDLDNNGRLEIISSYMSDGGQRSDNKILEVSEDYEKLVRVKTDYAQEEYQPDILVDTMTVYRNEKGIYYICYDYNNVYDEGAYESYQSLQFVDGKITGKLLCKKSTEFQQGKGLVTTYSDGEGTPITEEEYLEMIEKTFRNAYRGQMNLGWMDVADYDDVSGQELLSALTRSLEAFSVRKSEDTAPIVNNPKEEEYPFIGPVTEEFTMQDLVALCKADKVAEAMEDYVQKDGLLPVNIQRSYKEDALSWSYYYDLEYEGKSYTLRANYWNPANAQEYGHAPNQLFDVILYENTAGDALMLYSNDYRHAAAVPIMDIEDFLAKEYDMRQHLNLEVPEGTFLGAYDMSMNDIFQGSLILMDDYEQKPHGEWTPKAWYAPGGVGKTALVGNGAMEDRATFADGKLVGFHWLMNHAGGELVEVLEDCDMQALLYHYQFDVFTMQEIEEYARKYGISIEEVPNITDYWYVFFAELDSEYAYVIFLDQACFTKEDIVALARSVKFQ